MLMLIERLCEWLGEMIDERLGVSLGEIKFTHSQLSSPCFTKKCQSSGPSHHMSPFH